MKPRIGIIPGDPSGIGPELVAKLLNAEGVVEQADILLIGDRHIFEQGQQQAGLTFDLVPCDPQETAWTELDRFAFDEMETMAADEVRIAKATEAGGRSVLVALNRALDLASEGIIDSVIFAPFNKQAMKAGGLRHEDELHHMAEYLEIEHYISELNTLDGIWTSRVTSHIALRDVAASIDGKRIEEAVDLIDRTLKRSGVVRPRIAVAALNPHAGDGGNFGREEIDVIRPAVDRIARRQIDVDGPWPSDTVFLKAKRGDIDAVVTMYHDQGQIALKLMGFDRGVTVHGGLPFPVATPAHGTAFDIAGKGIADVGATRAAFEIACHMVNHWDREDAA